MFEYDSNGGMIGLSFQVVGPDGKVGFKLPAKWEAVHAILKDNSKIERKFRTPEHAQNVVWRLIRDWLRAQMSLIELEIADLAEVFMPYMLDGRGNTVYELFQRGQLALGDGSQQ